MHPSKPSDRSDTTLMRQWQSGEREAGAVLLQRHLPAIRRFFRRKLPRADADDLVQRTFVGLVEGTTRFRGEGSVPALITAIARRQLWKFMREQTRRSARHELQAGVADTSSADRSGSAWLLGAEQHEWLQCALARLPDEQRIVVELYYWHELSAPEIAARLGVSPITVRTRLHRGRIALERVLVGTAGPCAGT